MKEKKYKLTKNSKEILLECHNYNGVIFIKKPDNAIETIEMWKGRDGKFYAWDKNVRARDLIEYLNDRTTDIWEK